MKFVKNVCVLVHSIGIGLFIFLNASVSAQNYRNLGLHSEITKVQPMTGIVFWTDNNTALTALGDHVQLEFSYLVYADVITDKDAYDWTAVDNLLEAVASRGHQAILRFRYVYPGVTKPSVPDYIRSLSTYNDQILRVEKKSTYVPDWSSAALQNFTKDFYTEFAKRYDADPRIAFLQIGFGSYSEYHLYDGPLDFGQTFPSKAYQADFLKHVNTQFIHTQWAISIDAASDSYTPFVQDDSLKDLNFGVFDDSFLHRRHSESNDEYNRSSWLFFGANRANASVAGGEFNYYTDFDQEHVLDVPNGPHGTSFEDLAKRYDVTYMIGNDQLKYQSKERIKEAGMNVGYRFSVTSFRTDGRKTELTIRNEGTAPIYYDAYPSVNGVRATVSLKGLAKNQSKIFVIDTEALDEQVTIVSDRLVGGQRIEFYADLEPDVLSVTNFGADAKEINVFPNPFDDELRIRTAQKSLYSVVLRDIQGRVVLSETFNERLDLDTSNLKNGVYLVSVKHDDVTRSRIFIKK